MSSEPLPTIVVVDTQRGQAATLEAAMRPLGQLVWVNSSAEAVAKSTGGEQIFLAGLSRPAKEAVQCLHELQKKFPGSASVLVAEYGDFMTLDSTTRTRDNLLLAFRPFEMPKLVAQVERAASAVRLASQLAKMREVLGRNPEKAK